MDEFKRLANSRKGYRIYLKKLLLKATDLIQRQRDKATESDIPSLTELRDLRDQLQRKDKLISTLNTELIKHIKDEEELVTEVCEAEEIKESISTSIAHISQIIETLSVDTISTPTLISTHSDTSSTQSSSDSSPTSGATSTTVNPVENPPPRNVEQPTSLVSASHDTTRLPKLSIPTFSGDTLQWQSFWDCFEAAVHLNPSISNVQKLNHL